MSSIDRKILLIGRHGKAPQKPEGGSYDRLLPETISQVYYIGKNKLSRIVKQHSYTPQRTFFMHSRKRRTNYTGKSYLIGGFGFKPSEGRRPPKDSDDFAYYPDLRKIKRIPNGNFNIAEPDVNLAIHKDPERGPAVNIHHWINHPYAKFHEGVEHEPYISAQKRHKDGILDCLHELFMGGNDLGVVVTHANIVEPVAINLINTGRKSPVRDLDEIQDIGLCDMAQFARLTIDYKRRSGYFTAKLNFNNRKYDVDLMEL